MDQVEETASVYKEQEREQRQVKEEGRSVVRREKQETVWQKAIHHKQETVLIWKQRAAAGRTRLEKKSTVQQSHRSVGWGGRWGVVGRHRGPSSPPPSTFAAALTCVSLHPPLVKELKTSPLPLHLLTSRAPWLGCAAASPSACGRRAAARSPGSSTASSGRRPQAGSRPGRPSCSLSPPVAPLPSAAEAQKQRNVHCRLTTPQVKVINHREISKCVKRGEA